MTPLTVNPTVVLAVDGKGRVTGVATNVAADLEIVVATDDAAFKDEASNKPFRSDVPETSPAFKVGYSFTPRA